MQFGHDGAMGVGASIQAWTVEFDDGLRKILRDIDGSFLTQIGDGEIRGPFRSKDDAMLDLHMNKGSVHIPSPKEVSNMPITKESPNHPIIQKSSGNAGSVTSTARDMDASFLPQPLRVAMDKMTSVAVKPIEAVSGKKINTQNPMVRWGVAAVLGVGMFMLYKRLRKRA